MEQLGEPVDGSEQTDSEYFGLFIDPAVTAESEVVLVSTSAISLSSDAAGSGCHRVSLSLRKSHCHELDTLPEFGYRRPNSSPNSVRWRIDRLVDFFCKLYSRWSNVV